MPDTHQKERCDHCSIGNSPNPGDGIVVFIVHLLHLVNLDGLDPDKDKEKDVEYSQDDENQEICHCDIV